MKSQIELQCFKLNRYNSDHIAKYVQIVITGWNYAHYTISLTPYHFNDH